MKNAKVRKIQYLLITELLNTGSVELLLPDGITLEIGINQEDEYGDIKKSEDYCYVVATRDTKSAILDSYNLGLQFLAEKDTIVYEDKVTDHEGNTIQTLEVI